MVQDFAQSLGNGYAKCTKLKISYFLHPHSIV